MQVNKIEYTNFNGCYKLANTLSNVAKLTNIIAPAYIDKTNQSILIFSGNNPFKIVVKKIINEVAKKNNSSVEWLKMNAKNHGLYMNDDGYETLNIITSGKDINSFYDYFVARIERLKPTLKNKIIRALGLNKTIPRIDKDLPEHLMMLSYSLNFDKEETAAFKEYSKDFKTVSSAEQLFELMMRE